MIYKDVGMVVNSVAACGCWALGPHYLMGRRVEGCEKVAGDY